jgi:bifunctional DNase/RNase
MVRMQVHKVGLDPQRQPLVLLADEPVKRLLPIWIGNFEAHAISTQLQGKSFPRPLTHELLLAVLTGLGGRLEEVQVTRLEDGVFYAVLVIAGPSGRLEIDSRPSDALTLAVATAVPIYVAEAVLDQAQILSDDGEAEENDRLRDLLSGLDTTVAESVPEDDAAGGEPER